MTFDNRLALNLLLSGNSNSLQETCDAVAVAIKWSESSREGLINQTYYSARNLTSSMGALKTVRLFAPFGVPSGTLPSSCQGSHESLLVVSKYAELKNANKPTSASKTLTRHPARRKEAI
jgi:hypothetical protein